MITSDISEQVKEAYGVNVSEGTISNVTNKVIEHVKEWHNRPLEPVYFTVWMDGIVPKAEATKAIKLQNRRIFLIIFKKRPNFTKLLESLNVPLK